MLYASRSAFDSLSAAGKCSTFVLGHPRSRRRPPLLLPGGSCLVRVLGHCGECHTPRTAMGGPKAESLLGGAKIPEGKVPNITPTRMQRWKDADFKEYFNSGTTPGGDLALEPMSEVINRTTSQWTKEDVDAVIAYLRSVPAQPEPK